MIDILQLLREINETLHRWDDAPRQEGQDCHTKRKIIYDAPRQEGQDWHAKRKAIYDAGYEIYEVDVWDKEGNEIIRRDQAIAPRMEDS